jgi:hypothetical protein
VANVEALSDLEKKSGIKGDCTFVPYDKGDKGGNRWYLETPYYINWSKENVNFLISNSGKKGKGMPVVRNLQFYFMEGFCWSDIHTVHIKSRFKGKSVYDVKSMSLFPLITSLTSKYIVCILNSHFASEFSIEFLNNTSTLQINDARCIPLIVPTREELSQFEDLFDKAFQLQIKKFDKSMLATEVQKELDVIQVELDEKVNELYLGN